MTEQQQEQISSTIGQYLKTQRKDRNLSLERISQHTKISMKKLELIEDEKFEELPSLAYVTGFVKSYAKTLHLDQSYCLELLDKAYGIKKEPIPEEQLERLSDSDKPSIEPFSGLPLGKIVAGLGVLTLIIGILVFVGQNQTQDQPEKKVMPKSVDSDTPLAETRPPVTIDTPPVQEELTENQEQENLADALPESQETQEPPVQDEENQNQAENIEDEELGINLRPFPAPTFDWDNEMSQSRIDELIPEDKKIPPQEGQHHIYIKAIEGETWLTYKTDDKNIRRFVLKEGRDIFLTGQVHRIFLGNINATEIFINNRPIQVQSRTGVKSLVIPREAYTKFTLPLFIYPETGGVMTSEEYQESLEELD